MSEEMKPEHRIFCEEVVIDWNQTRAYMVAYPNSQRESARRKRIKVDDKR